MARLPVDQLNVAELLAVVTNASLKADSRSGSSETLCIIAMPFAPELLAGGRFYIGLEG
jgi:hypothetical protein